jgi:rSAM/selenodomain-associated transferase 1
MSGRPEKNKLIIFVKYPEPGRVKSRIASEIGAEKAAGVYSLMAETIIEKVSKTDAHETIIFFDPPEREKEIIAWLGNSVRSYEHQRGTTIGDKMSNAFLSGFSSGAEKAVLIGTDIPEITADTVRAAFKGLDETDVVLGPAEDGGYYLIGLRQPEPRLFSGISWSTNVVLAQTIDRIEELSLEYYQLETLRDIDTYDDISEGKFVDIKEN